MTATAEAIVTALGSGPATARALSQRLDGIGYANIRQALRRLSAAGTVTKLRRGLYAAGTVACDEDAQPAAQQQQQHGGGSAGLHVASRARRQQANPERASASARNPERGGTRPELARPTVDWSHALAGIWADFEAMNDPRDPRAWA